MLWCEEQLQYTSQGAMIISDTNNANHKQYLKKWVLHQQFGEDFFFCSSFTNAGNVKNVINVCTVTCMFV